MVTPSAAWGPTARDEEEEHEDHEVHDGVEVQRQPRGALAQVQGLTLVHFSAEPEPTLTQNTP
jgi:hypothetical protein